MLVTFSDIKIPTGSGSQPFMVDLLSKSEYYPYGMVIDELSYNLSNNRYGFGGTHELDNEVKGGVGNHLSFGDFGYDTRVARRFNLDPIDQIFISNYAGFGNNPITYADPTGYSYCEFCEDVTPQEFDVAAEIAIDEGIKSIEKSVDNALNKIFDISTSIINSVYVGGQSYGSWSNLGSPEPYAVKNRKIDGSVATGKEVLLSTVETTLMVTPLPKVGRISQYFSMPGTNTVLRAKVAEEVEFNIISRIVANNQKELKQLVNKLSQNKIEGALSQLELDELRVLVKKYGGTVRVDLDGIYGYLGSIQNAGKSIPHVQDEGFGTSISKRHIIIQEGVR